MDVFEALYTTRAMRRVSEDPIPDDVLKQMVDAGIRAPSGSNRQGWKFIVVTDPEIRNQLEICTEKPGIFMLKNFMEELLIWEHPMYLMMKKLSK